MTASNRQRNRRGAGAELRATLIDATAELLCTHTVDDLSVRVVTTAAGVSPTALYLQFADLTELVHTVKLQFFGELAERLRTASAAGDDLPARLRNIATAYLSYAAESPGHYAVIFHIDKRTNGPAEPPVAVLVEAGFQAFQPLQDAVGTAIGHLATDADVLETTIELWLSLHGRAHLAAAMPWFSLPDPDRYVDRLISRVLATAPPRYRHQAEQSRTRR